MELKNANSNGCHVVLSSKQTTPNAFIFFPKIWKTELNRGLQRFS